MYYHKILIIIFFFGNSALAHNHHEGHQNLKEWTYTENNKLRKIKGSFLLFKEDEKLVYLERSNHEILKLPISQFSQADKEFILHKYEHVIAINKRIAASNSLVIVKPSFDFTSLMMIIVCIIIGIISYYYLERKKLNYVLAILVSFMCMFLFSFIKKMLPPPALDYAAIDKAFIPFKPNVVTRADASYVYVESVGIPTEHEMMIGITGWQQQFPIPQCYNGTNAWSIPLNPSLASTPVPVNASHFTRGAIAIAVNGIPIFNPYTNTGIDAYVDGQLDNYGGHCGRADDYHYHASPLSLFSSLYSKTSATLPFAYAFDGFAIYGSKEPEGGAMTSLDVNHGHLGADGNYHYHGTNTAPYMIGSMVGNVTEDASLQIVPQAQASPIRPAGEPLKGAVITNCLPNSAKNAYTLSYTLAGQKYSVEYNWSPSGFYTFNTIAPSGTSTLTYDSKKTVCKMVTTTSNITNRLFQETDIHLYPNPSHELLNISLNPNFSPKDISAISIYNVHGKVVYYSNEFKSTLDLKKFAKGTYFMKINIRERVVVKNIQVN